MIPQIDITALKILKPLLTTNGGTLRHMKLDKSFVLKTRMTNITTFCAPSKSDVYFNLVYGQLIWWKIGSAGIKNAS